jgi:hypothetical protein
MVPTEKYLLIHRLFVFFDEWLFYAVLALLFFTQKYLMLIPVLIFGAFAIGLAYKKQWAMENKRFESEINENSGS